MEFKVNANGATDVGRIRSINQDSILVDNDNRLYIVADGMGGHAGGEIASRLCIEGVIKYLINKEVNIEPTNQGDTLDPKLVLTMVEAINHASAKIYEKALEDPSLKGMGTTATILKFYNNFAFWAHVGDSRLYLLRAGLIYQLTHDHSLVSEQVRAGVLTQEEAELHHLRNVITRSVGYQEEEDVDTGSIQLEKDDLFLVCSDGLHGKIDDREIAKILKTQRIAGVNRLIAAANERGGDDNISAIIVNIQE